MAWERKRTPEVIIGLCHVGITTMEWSLSYRTLKHPSCLYSFQRGVPIDVARNRIAEKCLDTGCKWLFFWDSDVLIESDTLERLMAHNLPIVSGLYYKRHPHTCPRCGGRRITPAMWVRAERVGRKPEPGKKYIAITKFPMGKLVDADVIGMGCCLIHRRVLERIRELFPKKPFFYYSHGREKEGVSEDFSFCELAKQAGFRILVDTSVVTKHITEFKISGQGMVPDFLEPLEI